MDDDKLEETIKGLKELSGFLFREYGRADSDKAKTFYDRFLAVDNALKLLKKQEPIMIKTVMINGNGRNGRCQNCLMMLNEMDYPDFCGFCGQAVKWE